MKLWPFPLFFGSENDQSTWVLSRDWRGGFFSIEDEWGWVWAETTEDERVRVRPNSTKQRANMIFDCLIFLLSDVFHWWKYIPSLVVSWFAIIITVINCTGFIYTILLRKDPLMLGNHKNITFITVILSSSELENLKKNFEARWGLNFSEAKSRVPRPRHSLAVTTKLVVSAYF